MARADRAALAALVALSGCGVGVAPQDATPDSAIDAGVVDSADVAPLCSAGQQRCGERCVDTQTDFDHCGRCWDSCEISQQCQSGRCGCPAGLTACGDRCADVRSDNGHCGACGVRCGEAERCISGACQCFQGYARCGVGGACVSIVNDPENCGACGARCAGVCLGARCASLDAVRAGGNATFVESGGGAIYAAGRSNNPSVSSTRWLAAAAPFGGAIVEGSLSVGAGHQCGIRWRDTVQCVGLDNYRQCGAAAFGLSIPMVRAVSAGGFHTCALDAAGVVRCWGANGSGQCGAPPTMVTAESVAITGASMVSAGAEHTCALVADRVSCWGLNRSGQLGDGTVANSHAPRVVAGLAASIVGISAGGTATCAWTTAGTVQCWGGNQFSELGDDGALPSGSLRTIAELSGVTQVSVGGSARSSHVCALAAGLVRCWGANESGQTGERATLVRTSRPTVVEGLPPDITQISAGLAHTCARSAAQGIWCWGANGSGQLADGTTVSRATPRRTLLRP